MTERSAKRLWLVCEICAQRIGFWSEREHLERAHPEIMLARGKSRRTYLAVYFPLAMGAFIFALVSLAIREWWWRFGFLGGIYVAFALLMVFGIRHWKREKPLHMDVQVSCSVCEQKLAKRDMDGHMQMAHPMIHRQMHRTAWLITTVPYGFLVYVLALITVMILEVLPDWSIVTWLVFGPTFAWTAVLAAVGIYMEHRYLKPAKAEWKILRPPRS